MSLRFCQYNHRGGFRRSPLMMGPEDVEMMREGAEGDAGTAVAAAEACRGLGAARGGRAGDGGRIEDGP